MKVKYFTYINEGIFVFQNCYLDKNLINNYSKNNILGSFQYPEITATEICIQGANIKQSQNVVISKSIPSYWDKAKIELDKLNT